MSLKRLSGYSDKSRTRKRRKRVWAKTHNSTRKMVSQRQWAEELRDKKLPNHDPKKLARKLSSKRI